ncbi:YkgJ family cysteine cluster protein [Pelagicoccus mobilis]|uniref:YkgJ family cysteine cluster protein n=1 Tax=Pelagicoccus mobilis TaxID=415221 RepID=A0A934VR31_9BACT|nr:YkgJ family cysteine cluster protein [Pelagicoccus mobilis]MBK1877520.1 YkgJ family cysteine cluster protein [Pelagicoccus mobilis]
MSGLEDGDAIVAGEEFDCTDCGACCRCYPIFASESDAAREPEIEKVGVRVEQFLGKEETAYRLFPLARVEGCGFLKQDQLCRIYDTRPEVCRKFTAGSEQCIRARERVGVGRR